MREIVPGVFHWVRRHPRIGIDVSSTYLADERVVLDPMVPEEGLDALPGEPTHVLLTNRHHFRESAAFRERFGCEVLCPEAGMHELRGEDGVRPFRCGDELPGGIEALEIGVLCPDETALYVARNGGMLAVADGVIRDGDGPLGFVPEELLGEDPEEIRSGLKAAWRRVAEEHAFDHLLLAHGAPWIGGAREALLAFATS